MDNLVMPLALPGREIEADNGIAEQIISRTMAAIVISSWIFDGQVHEAEVFICRHLRPYPGVPVGRPRIVLPGIVPELAGARNQWRPEMLPPRLEPWVPRSREYWR